MLRGSPRSSAGLPAQWARKRTARKRVERTFIGSPRSSLMFGTAAGFPIEPRRGQGAWKYSKLHAAEWFKANELDSSRSPGGWSHAVPELSNGHGGERHPLLLLRHASH